MMARHRAWAASNTPWRVLRATDGNAEVKLRFRVFVLGIADDLAGDLRSERTLQLWIQRYFDG